MVAGRTYRTPAGLIAVDAIDVVTDRITKADARQLETLLSRMLANA